MTGALEMVERHGEAMVHNLGADCMAGARGIVESLERAGELPAGVDVLAAFRVILSMRATLELMAVEQRFGTPAHDRLLEAMEEYYGRTLLERGRFASWIAAAHETMRRSEDPRQWMRIHAMNLLGTREPEAATFHLALGYGFHVGASLANVLAEHVVGAGTASEA